MPNPILAIEAALTQTQRDAILAKFPHMSGAKVADLLAEGVDSDAELDRTEPWWEAHRNDADWPEGTQAALLALAWAGSTGFPAELNVGRVRALLGAAGLMEPPRTLEQVAARLRAADDWDDVRALIADLGRALKPSPPEYHDGLSVMPPAKAASAADRLRIQIIGIRAGWSAWAAREAAAEADRGASDRRWGELMAVDAALRNAEMDLEAAIKRISEEAPGA